ncbi:MAG: D-alanyl-D-alanine carboxypeptidase/D-alanyl-D-alanine-endopeptidase [Bacteroidia bacterium]|nr:D-alanyl-D-alanine carboxypeptidase/D-alanyl-D-alanine-endopeptidase [Bacteroidia bacterium]
MRLLTLYIFLFLIESCSFAQPFLPDKKNKFSSVKEDIEKLKSDTNLKNASISFYAMDLSSKETIAEYNPAQSLVPASSLKVVTTAAALEIMGEGTRFKTAVEYDGSIDSSGTLNGNIYIRGGGDPSLGSGLFEKHYYKPLFLKVWADSISKKGIKKINGSIIADAGIFDDQTPVNWVWGDMANYFGATAYGISIYDNIFSLFFETGKNSGDSTSIVSIDPIIPGLNIINKVKTYNGTDDESYIIGAPFDNTRFAYGSLPKDKKKYEVRGSIPDPPLLTAYELRSYLDSLKISVKELPTTVRQLKLDKKFSDSKRTVLCETWSPRLSEIIYWTNRLSMNIYAETLLKQIGLRKFRSGDTMSGIKAITEFWKSKGVDVKGMFLSDGSGLSRYNSISAKHLVQVLNVMKDAKSYKTFYNSLPTAGLSGTIRKMFKNTNAEKNLRAKSGYMSRVRSYAGYVTTVSKRDIAFSFIVNNYNCDDQKMKEMIEMLLVKLADLNE